MNTQV